MCQQPLCLKIVFIYLFKFFNRIFFLNLLEVFTTLNSNSVQYYFISLLYIIHYFYYDNLCNLYNNFYCYAHIFSSLFMIVSLNFIDSDVSRHYYIFIIDSVYYCIRIYVTFLNMCTLSMK